MRQQLTALEVLQLGKILEAECETLSNGYAQSS